MRGRKFLLLNLFVACTIMSFACATTIDKNFKLATQVNKEVLITTENLVLDAYQADAITWEQLMEFEKVDKKAVALHNLFVLKRDSISLQNYYITLQEMIVVLDKIGVEIPYELKVIAKTMALGQKRQLENDAGNSIAW